MTTPANEPTKRRVICVFCGSKAGKGDVHKKMARELAEAFHAHNIQLVYGGGKRGIMGEMARTLVKLSGPDAVFGVIPHALVKYERAEGGEDDSEAELEAKMAAAAKSREMHEDEYGRTVIVSDMHSRKQMMARKVMEGAPGSGFCALTGGYGTLEELMEMTTWNQLGIHSVGVCVFNVAGFYDGLLDWIRRATEEGFVSKKNSSIIVEAKTPAEVIEALGNYTVSEGRFKLDWSMK